MPLLMQILEVPFSHMARFLISSADPVWAENLAASIEERFVCFSHEECQKLANYFLEKRSGDGQVLDVPAQLSRPEFIGRLRAEFPDYALLGTE